MAIDASKVQWDAAPALDISAVQWDAAPTQAAVAAPRQPGFLTQLGRSAASLADITVGGVLPAVVQQVGYPLARLGRSPEQAQAATARLVNAVESPVGKAFGVTETPEYQQEAGRQVLDFIGQNFQKGAKWIAGKTGLPQSDIENYLGTATLAAPKVAPPVARAIRDVAAPQIEKAVIGAKMPFEARAQAKRERLSQEDYARGPQIDALEDARRLGFLVNPVDIQSSVGTRLLTTAAGEKGAQNITRANKNRARDIALGEMELPPTTQLNGDAAFNQARKQVAGPYEQVKQLPIQQADDAMVQRLEALRADLDVIGAQDYAPAIGKIVDDAISKTQTGLTGEQLLKNISVLRNRAKRTYNNKAATDDALDIADTNLKIATELESMIDGSISNPKLLDQFRDARQKMARSYAYEGATDFNTGVLDVNKLARITAKNSNLTGDIAAIGRIAGNNPEAFTNKVATPFSKALSIGRSGAAGTFGGVAGYALGQDYISAAAGTVLGALGGKIGESAAARIVASPKYQAGLNLRDARIPVNQLAASMQPIPQNRAIVPYEAPVEVLGQGDYVPPNFVMQGEGRAPTRAVWDPATKTYRAEFAPEVTPMVPEAPRNMLGYDPNVPVQGQPGAFNIMRQRERDLSMRQGAAAEQQIAAAEAAIPRQTTGRGTAFDFDSITGKLVPVDSTLRGATPDIQIIESTGKNLQSAIDKIVGQMQADTTTKFSTRKTTSGKQVRTIDEFGDTIISKTGPKFKTTGKTTVGESTREPSLFNLTAEEKIAWNKTKVDLAEVMPGMRTLSNEAIASRMADVKWSEQAVANARAKVAQLARQEAMLTEQLANRNNLRLMARDIEAKNKQLVKIQSDRQSMMALAEQMEEGLRAGRPVKTGGQGPKTREFQRKKLNMLSDQDVVNELLNR